LQLATDAVAGSSAIPPDTRSPDASLPHHPSEPVPGVDDFNYSNGGGGAEEPDVGNNGTILRKALDGDKSEKRGTAGDEDDDEEDEDDLNTVWDNGETITEDERRVIMAMGSNYERARAMTIRRRQRIDGESAVDVIVGRSSTSKEVASETMPNKAPAHYQAPDTPEQRPPSLKRHIE
jgi:hypothetical protein